MSTVPKMYNKILFDKISLCYCSFAEFVLQYTRGIVIMTNVIVVASGKGGTGKSTVCICLSVALLRQGKRVLLIATPFAATALLRRQSIKVKITIISF